MILQHSLYTPSPAAAFQIRNSFNILLVSLFFFKSKNVFVQTLFCIVIPGHEFEKKVLQHIPSDPAPAAAAFQIRNPSNFRLFSLSETGLL